jgi:hypothetical protein
MVKVAERADGSTPYAIKHRGEKKLGVWRCTPKIKLVS